METRVETRDECRARKWNRVRPPGTCIELLPQPKRPGQKSGHWPGKPCNTTGAAFVDDAGVSVVRVDTEAEPVSLLRCRVPSPPVPEWSKETARRRYMRLCSLRRGRGIYFRLQGKWFAACGFKGGARVGVSCVRPGKLAIGPAENADEKSRIRTVSYGNSTHLPFLMISGDWLVESGFKLGDTVCIEPLAPALMEITVDPSCPDISAEYLEEDANA